MLTSITFEFEHESCLNMNSDSRGRKGYFNNSLVFQQICTLFCTFSLNTKCMQIEKNRKLSKQKHKQRPLYKYHLYFCPTKITTENILVTPFPFFSVFMPLSVAVST